MWEFYVAMVLALVTANIISIALSMWAMSNGGIVNWIMTRCEKMFESWEKL